MLKTAFNLPPYKAIEHLERKGMRLSWDWTDTWEKEHVEAFTVAKAMRMDVLEDIRDMVEKSLTEGIPFEQFRRDLTPKLKAKGWWGRVMVGDGKGGAEEVQLGSPWRLRTIYHTNLQTSLMAGRYDGMMQAAQDRPYWQNISVIDARTTDRCRGLHLQIFRYNDPIWDTFYPPSHWGCRRRVRSMSERQVKGKDVQASEGKLVRDQVPVRTRRGTRMADVTGYKTVGPDGMPTTVWTQPGFNYNPGKTRWKPDAKEHDRDLYRKYEQANARRGIAQRVVVNSRRDLDSLVKTYADENPVMFQRGFRQVRMGTGSENAMAATNCNGTIWISTINHGIGTSFNPADEIVSACAAIRKGKALTFKQEYSLECLWHEILHNRSSNPALPVKNGPAHLAMETLNQWVSRRSYPRFLHALGTTARNQQQVIREGFGYSHWVRNFDILLEELSLKSDDIFNPLQMVLYDAPYQKMHIELSKELSALSKNKRSTVRKALREVTRWQSADKFRSVVRWILGAGND